MLAAVSLFLWQQTSRGAGTDAVELAGQAGAGCAGTSPGRGRGAGGRVGAAAEGSTQHDTAAPPRHRKIQAEV